MEVGFEIVLRVKDIKDEAKIFRVGDIVRVICKKHTYVGRLHEIHDLGKAIVLDTSREYYSTKVSIPAESIRYMRLENAEEEK